MQKKAMRLRLHGYAREPLRLDSRLNRKQIFRARKEKRRGRSPAVHNWLN
jgi:hypothetical protein